MLAVLGELSDSDAKMQTITVTTNYDIIGGNFGTKSTLACTELTCFSHNRS